ncbi:MAG: electron transfer flavoprotein subunit alpha/FixB family protein [Alphaproteobacteria bacterium]|nr:electron transfer flavoprotein subunit alpha/FixB family protein [Alphaproteobacteria bacterium]
MRVLVVAEHDNISLRPSTLHTVTAAQRIGGEIHLLVAGHNCGSAAESATRIPGIASVMLADDARYGHFLAEPLALLITTLAERRTHVLAPSTPFGKNVMPRVAALLDVQQISDIVGIEAPDTFTRPIYAGSALATVRSTDRVKVITVRGTAFALAPMEAGRAPIDNVASTPAGATSGATFLSRELSRTTRPELNAARVIVAGGRGMGSSDAFRLIEAVADRLGAAIGASRAAVDAGYMPNDFQVGQTGKIVAPDLYLAVGISGAIQHLAGMKDSKVIVAINKDEEAPIFQIADYGLVADLFQALPELTAELDRTE